MAKLLEKKLTEQSSGVIEHRAINPAGRLGFLYDGFRDILIDETNSKCRHEWLKSFEPVKCELIKGTLDSNFNLLKCIGIQSESRLSLLLNTMKRSGIAEVLNYPYRIDHYIRFLYYSWALGKRQYLETELCVLDNIDIWDPELNGTHMITSITFGIDVIIALQLPPEDIVIKKIDNLLEKIRDEVRIDRYIILKLTSDDNDLLRKVVRIKIYSNAPSFLNLTSVVDVFREIDVIKQGKLTRFPLGYTLRLVTTLGPQESETSIKSLYPLHAKKAEKFRPLSSSLDDRIEQFLLKLRNSIAYAEAFLNENIPNLFDEYLADQLNKARIELSYIKDEYKKNIQRLAKLIVDFRGGAEKTCEIDQVLSDNFQQVLKTGLNQLTQTLTQLEKKRHLITNLQQQHFDYMNEAEYNIDQNDGLKMDEHKVLRSDQHKLFLCSNDTLNENNSSKLADLRQISEKHQSNPTLSLTYVDFSNYSLQLDEMIVLPSNNIDYSESHTNQNVSSLDSIPHSPSTVPLSASPLVSNDETINILLLGETGVGKSTFINAFANYLIFQSLEQAGSNEPIVVIPVSFIMTTGENFEERTVKFGETDSFNNENFNVVGQSVTQHCKSYTFDLKRSDNNRRRKVRIIDTPGFGDTRGVDQDERNMEHILQYINNLTHLHAICFLLKPNASRLNVFFRTCFMQLFSFLAPTAQRNVVFCFTNARSTFYTPGNTAPLLKTMLASLSTNDISFKKENAFCFDSESFRYLVALRNKIEFTDEEKQEYQMSWSTSVKESNHLIDYIENKLTVYHIENGWQSIKHAQFEITYMIRPILETMRNILRNFLLCKSDQTNQYIELHSRPLHLTAARCRSCKGELKEMDKFYIFSTDIHEIQNECTTCSCSVDKHVPIDYTLNYRWSNTTFIDYRNNTGDILNRLCQMSAQFAYFLIHTASSTKYDPFLDGLQEIIIEETYICEIQKSTGLNKELVLELSKLKNQYEECMRKIESNESKFDLPALYELMKVISKYPTAREQLTTVKKRQRMLIEQYEYGVHQI
ncbi:unnamed protein product [Rotaria sp. Silwood2]|nr:unnamed protein product [Rotaria sp. Silwood2]